MKPAMQIGAPDWAGIDANDPSAISDAIRSIYGVVNQLSAAIASRIGVWKDVPYDATMFSGVGGGGPVAWTVQQVDIARFRYIAIDNFLIVTFQAYTTDIVALTNQLLITVPGGYVAKVDTGGVLVGLFNWFDVTGGTEGNEALYVNAAGRLSATRAGGIDYPVTAAFEAGFFAVFEILPTSGN